MEWAESWVYRVQQLAGHEDDQGGRPQRLGFVRGPAAQVKDFLWQVLRPEHGLLVGREGDGQVSEFLDLLHGVCGIGKPLVAQKRPLDRALLVKGIKKGGDDIGKVEMNVCEELFLAQDLPETALPGHGICTPGDADIMTDAVGDDLGEALLDQLLGSQAQGLRQVKDLFLLSPHEHHCGSLSLGILQKIMETRESKDLKRDLLD